MNSTKVATAGWSEVLPLVSRALGLQGLARLMTSSERNRSLCLTLITQDTKQLLQSALPLPAAAAAAGAAGLHPRQAADQSSLQAVLWMLRVAPEAATAALTVASTAEHVVLLPAVPLDAAVQLVAAGVRITYAQLLAAAKSMVPGVEVWVQAQQQLGVQTDMPAAAVAICLGDYWVSADE
jgi:hypothetical protein